MCGIVGILGQEPVAFQLVESLKRLEYRGYDSAGVAVIEGGQMDAAVQTTVQRMATTAPQAIAATKHLLLQVQSALPLPALLDDAAHLFARALRGPEAPQGLAAFTARKAPPWSPAA